MERVTHDLAAGIAALGHEVSVVAFTKRGKASLKREGDDVAIRRCPVWFSLASQPLTPRWVVESARRGRRVDVVHIHVPNMLAALALLFVHRGPQIVLHWHSDVIGKGALSILTRQLEHYLARRADVIVATSARYVALSPILSRYRTKVIDISLGIGDLPKESTSLERCLSPEIDNFVQDRKLILSVGRLVTYKGYHVLIDALQKIDPNACVVVVGTGPLEGMLRQRASYAGFDDRLMFAGVLPSSALAALFRRADLYVMPSIERSEAFGVVLLEAMVNGLPVVATNIDGSGVPWVNQHEVTGLNVPVRDPGALAAAINTLLRDPSKAARFAKAARARYIAQFTSTAMIAAFEKLYAARLAAANGATRRRAPEA
jgi:glycosyltransferase involved in cell wall biosynthesis